MSVRDTVKYDAFISYRHSELDSFVAENVHHELEKVRLPRNLAKTRAEGEKTRIERVFRDRDELPISADLSDNITKALEASDYLIVICSPRLKESIWCKSEIETFIALRGRERVLAVLAEGEPEESFPESITKAKKVSINSQGEEVVEWVDVEPLAADVRGTSKAEIKKKIKEEVIRLSAPIFDCNYDEIKQRHHEQKMRTRIQIASGVAAVCLAFGGFAGYQALRISKQNKQIDEQYKKIESQYQQIDSQYQQIDSQYTQIQDQYAQIQEQYSQNLIKQSEVVNSQVDMYLDRGLVDKSRDLILESITAAGDKLPAEAGSNYRYKLAAVLGVYDDGRVMRPKANFTMGEAIAIMCASSDYKYFAAADCGGTVALWDMASMEKVVEKKSDMVNATETYSKYFFDNNHNFLFAGLDSLNCISAESDGYNWSVEIADILAFAGIDGERLLAVSKSAFSIVNRADGAIVQTIAIDEGLAKNLTSVRKMFRTKDNQSMYIIGSGEDMSSVLKVSLKDLTVTANTVLDEDSIIAALGLSDGRLVVETIDFGGEQIAFDYKYYCLDGDTLETMWTKDADHYMKELYEFGDDVLAFYSGGIWRLDAQNFNVLETCQLDALVSDPLVMTDGRLKLLMNDGSVKLQNVGSLSFYENGKDGLHVTDATMFKYIGGLYALSRTNSNCICIYGLEETKEAKEKEDVTEQSVESIGELSYVFKDSDGNLLSQVEVDSIVFYGEKERVVNLGTSFVSGYYYYEAADVFIVQYGDGRIEVFQVDANGDKKVYTELRAKDKVEIVDCGEDYFVIYCDKNEGYVINRKSFLVEACVYGFVSYNPDSHEFLAKSAKDTYYTVPFFTLEELMEKAK